jgi:hypothetical protein
VRTCAAFVASSQKAAPSTPEFLADITERIAWIAESDFTGSPRDHISPGFAVSPIGSAASTTGPIPTGS